MGKVEGHGGSCGEFGMFSHLAALVPGDGASHQFGQICDVFNGGVDDTVATAPLGQGQ